MDCYVANKEDLSPERARLYFEANHNKLSQDQKKAFDYIKRLIEGNNKEQQAKPRPQKVFDYI